jgi:hypothetical protein
LESGNLVELELGSNDFSMQNLGYFSKFVHLEILKLGSNNFHGSLEPLKNMSKLKRLSISNTDINSGLEFLLESIEEFSCSTGKRSEAKVKVIEQELKNHGEPLQDNFVNLFKT